MNDIIDALNRDGAKHTDPTGRVWTLTIERDDIPPMEVINDADYWGRVAWGETNRNTGNDQRPDGFNGAAHKLSIYGYATEGTVWWQPPGPDMIDQDAIPMAKREVARLLSDGFVQVGVTTDDGYTAWLSGIDSVEEGYLRVVVGEHVHEIQYEIRDAAEKSARETFQLIDAYR